MRERESEITGEVKEAKPKWRKQRKIRLNAAGSGETPARGWSWRFARGNCPTPRDANYGRYQSVGRGEKRNARDCTFPGSPGLRTRLTVRHQTAWTGQLQRLRLRSRWHYPCYCWRCCLPWRRVSGRRTDAGRNGRNENAQEAQNGQLPRRGAGRRSGGCRQLRKPSWGQRWKKGRFRLMAWSRNIKKLVKRLQKITVRTTTDATKHFTSKQRKWGYWHFKREHISFKS